MIISTIKVNVWTSSTAGAGTNSSVSLGICGREFVLDTSGNDFEQGQEQSFVLGAGSNVLNAALNDPRKPQLDTNELGYYPVYLHFNSLDAKDTWCVEGVTVLVNPSSSPLTYGNTAMLGGGDKELWMGADAGKTLYLKKQ
ncbi:hypothetical protein [Streptomyces sp. NPDC048172]|uniref:hypothetical protein n=1 Tax=Streptomyces sp. NPDC048172 TaxID=3365505 RepID=UPI0037150BF4